MSFANATRLVLLLLPLLKQFPFLCTFFPCFFINLFFSDFSPYIVFAITKLEYVRRLAGDATRKRGLTLYKTNGKRLYRANHEVNTLEKTPTKSPHDRFKNEPFKNRTIKDSNDTELKEENEFSPVSRRRGRGSEYLEPFFPNY